jgi:hypothetical protein
VATGNIGPGWWGAGKHVSLLKRNRSTSDEETVTDAVRFVDERLNAR